jgi:hypothetical protein
MAKRVMTSKGIKIRHHTMCTVCNKKTIHYYEPKNYTVRENFKTCFTCENALIKNYTLKDKPFAHYISLFEGT